MPEVTANMMITLDGYATGEGQSRELPFGDLDWDRLAAWMFEHRAENAEEIAAITTAGAYIMGRNMFGPDRGEWDLDWRGWWGANPPYHAPVFVLSHRPRTSRRDGGRHRPSTSSPTGSRRRSSGRARPRGRRTSRSPAAPAPSISTSPRASSTSCGCTWCPSSLATVSVSSPASTTWS